jgi:nucleotide-binding universal stress UspA family protein
MSYKVLMAYVDLDGSGDARMSLVAELAERYHAALIGVSAWAPAPPISVDIAVLESVPDLADLQAMEDFLKAKGDKFRAIADKAGGPVEWRSALELPTEFVVQEVRAADLVIIGGSRHPVLRDPYGSVDPGAVLLRAGRPMLLVPPGVTSLAGKRIAVAWKDTREARRAIVDALPFLQKAETVAVVEFCESGEEATAAGRLKDVMQFLQRHDVNGAHELVRPVDVTLTKSLFRFVQDSAIDLIVAGGYGHSRLGEWMFGGLTRDLLINSPVCCLLSH